MLKNFIDTKSGKESVKSNDLTNKSGSSSQRQKLTDDSSGEDDNVSLFATGGFSGSESENEKDEKTDTNNNTDSTKMSRVGLFELFGQDAMVRQDVQSIGLGLDKAQIDALVNSYRSKEPNYLNAFSEDTFSLFPVDVESEKYIEVPSLDSLVDSILVKRYGEKASFDKNKKKALFSQPCKMIEKIAYKGQQSARLGLVIQMYLQQSLGNLLQFIKSEDFDKTKAEQQVKDIFAMSTKALDQVGRAGAFHHIIRRTVAMIDTALYEQNNSKEFSNLPLNGEGVFGPRLQTLLRERKEKKKQVDELIPDVKKKDYKRKFNGPQTEATCSKRPYERSNDRSSNGREQQWNNFLIPKLPREDSRPNQGWQGYKSRGFGQRRPTSTRGYGRGRSSRPNYK